MKCSKNSFIATISAILSAFVFAISIPFAKIFSNHIEPLIAGGLFYLGAGLGLLITLIFFKKDRNLNLDKKDLPYAISMVLLDICAISLLMLSFSHTTGANISLIGNFELVATTFFAFFIFKERISKKLFLAIILITTACIILNFEGSESFVFNFGSFLVLLSALCWGLENNCTRMLSKKDTRQITTIKGIFSGFGSLALAILFNLPFPHIKWIISALIVGFLSYGLSVCFYIYAQRFLGAAKTGAYYSIAPYFGVIFCLVFLKEHPQAQLYSALFIMIIGGILTVLDSKNS